MAGEAPRRLGVASGTPGGGGRTLDEKLLATGRGDEGARWHSCGWSTLTEGAARSADILIAPRTSAGQSSLVRGLRPGDAIAITREPAGGSERPSTTPLAIADSA